MKEKTMTVRIRECIHRQVKVEAARRGENLEFFTGEMILAGLRNLPKHQRGIRPKTLEKTAPGRNRPERD